MTCVVKTSLYSFINGSTAFIDYDGGNGLLEIIVDGARYVVAENEVERVA